MQEASLNRPVSPSPADDVPSCGEPDARDKVRWLVLEGDGVAADAFFSIRETKDVYGHLVAEDSRRAAEAMNRVLYGE